MWRQEKGKNRTSILAKVDFITREMEAEVGKDAPALQIKKKKRITRTLLFLECRCDARSCNSQSEAMRERPRKS